MLVSSIVLVSATAALSAGSLDPDVAQGLVVVGCIGYTMAYQLSFGPGVFVLGSEMFPAEIRGRFLGAQTFYGAVCLGITSELFPALVDRMGLSATFGLHLVAIVVCLVFITICLEETKVSLCSLLLNIFKHFYS